MTSLSLKNFKSWNNFVIELDGTVLIRGNSGTGKTTIFDAIIFALYGCVKSPQSFNSNFTSVTLKMFNFTITRSRPPKNLTVIRSGETYIESQAQTIIDDFFLPQTQFLNSCLIKQKSPNSILSLSPLEQLQLIECVCFKTSQGFSYFKNKINEYISKCKENISSENIKLDLYLKNKIELETTCVEEVIKPDYYHPDILKESQTKLKELEVLNKNLLENAPEVPSDKILKTICSLESQIKFHETKIKCLNSESFILDKTFWKDDADIEDRLRLYNQFLELLKIKKSYKKTKTKFYDFYNNFENSKRDRINEIDRDIKNIDINSVERKLKYPIYRETVAEAKDLSSQLIKIIKEKIPSIKSKTVKPVINALNKMDDSILKEIDELSILFTEKRKYLDQKDILSIVYSCPSCSENVVVVDGKLQLDDKTMSIEKAQDEFIMTSNQLKEKRQISSFVQESRDKLTRYYKIIQAKNTITPEESAELYSKTVLYKKLLLDKKAIIEKPYPEEFYTLEKLEDGYRELWDEKNIEFNRLYKELKIPENNIKFQINFVEEKIEELGKDLEIRFTNKMTKMGISQEIKEYEQKLNCDKLKYDILMSQKKEIDLKNSEINENKDKMDTLKNSMVELSSRINDIHEYEIYNSYMLKLNDVNKNIQSTKDEISRLEKVYKNSLVFKTKSIESEIQALNSIITKINKYATIYLREFFQKNIHVKIQATKGDTSKIKLNTMIVYKGNEYNNVNQLSGGERDRVNLAFTLALNEILGGKIIMLDETLSSLDEESKNVVFKFIKERLADKLILTISHEIDTSLFDQVVDV